MVKYDQMVGHIPKVNLKVCAFCIRLGGTIKCRVTGKRQHGLGLEIPCIYIFNGNEGDVKVLISLSFTTEKVINNGKFLFLFF